MLFYTALFLFSVACSVVIIWLVRSLASVCKSAYRAILPSVRSKTSAKPSPGKPANMATPSPWGWDNTSRPRRTGTDMGSASEMVKRVAERAWPESGSPAAMASDGTSGDRPRVGRPYREESPGVPRMEYRVVEKQQRKSKRGALNKPWGW